MAQAAATVAVTTSTKPDNCNKAESRSINTVVAFVSPGTQLVADNALAASTTTTCTAPTSSAPTSLANHATATTPVTTTTTTIVVAPSPMVTAAAVQSPILPVQQQTTTARSRSPLDVCVYAKLALPVFGVLPGVGPATASDLWELGFRSVAEVLFFVFLFVFSSSAHLLPRSLPLLIHKPCTIAFVTCTVPSWIAASCTCFAVWSTARRCPIHRHVTRQSANGGHGKISHRMAFGGCPRR